MSEVRVCDACRFKSYASDPGAATQTTVEYEGDDGTFLSAEWVLCSGCREKFTGVNSPSFCPFCLAVPLNHEPTECPDRAGNGGAA